MRAPRESKKVGRRVYARGGGHHYAVNYRDAAGDTGWCARGSLVEAEQTRDELDRLAANGIRLPSQKISAYDLVGVWLNDFQKRVDQGERSPRTLARYREISNTEIAPHLGLLTVRNIDRFTVQRLVLSMQERALAPSTHALVLKTFRALMSYAVSRKYHAYNPVEEFNRYAKADRHTDATTGERRHARTLSDPELRRLIEAAAPPWQPVFALASRSGLHTSELLALQNRNIDPAKQIVRVRKQLRLGQTHDLDRTDPRRRTVKLLETLGDLDLDTSPSDIPRRPSHLAFPGRQGKPRTPRSLDLALKQALRRAGLDPHLTAASLRDTFAAALIARGDRPLSISQQLGHATFDTTYRRHRQEFEHAGREDEAARARRDATKKTRLPAKKAPRRKPPTKDDLSGKRKSLPIRDIPKPTGWPWDTIRHLCEQYAETRNGQKREMAMVPLELLTRTPRGNR